MFTSIRPSNHNLLSVYIFLHSLWVIHWWEGRRW